MKNNTKAPKISLFSLRTPHMRTFHITWFSFFLCFFGWFGIAPLMAIVREELSLTQTQIGNTIIASVAITIVARLLIGWMCDRYGPRITYTGLLIAGSLPVMLIGLTNSYESFLLFRLAIGVIGAAFVITQYHTSMMFAPNVVGTANATTAGWGNLGGGVTQMVMPLIFAFFLALGFTDAISWRLAMVIPGIAMLIMAAVYYRYTQDYPEGNLTDLKKRHPEKYATQSKQSNGAFREAVKDYRVWALFVIYGACFGVELTIYNIAAIYYIDSFGLDLKTAGLIAGTFGLMNIFARSTGGFLGDLFGVKFGLRGRVWFLFGILFLEGVTLILFSQMSLLFLAVTAMILFSLCVQMAEGATYAVVPFVNKKAVGAVSGIVGAGGNAGAMAAGFLFRYETLDYSEALFIIGCVVLVCSFIAFLVRFSARDEVITRQELDLTLEAYTLKNGVKTNAQPDFENIPEGEEEMEMESVK
jgi:MFS transporter, NNP family, nitrate/nitrite transporter